MHSSVFVGCVKHQGYTFAIRQMISLDFSSKDLKKLMRRRKPKHLARPLVVSCRNNSIFPSLGSTLMRFNSSSLIQLHSFKASHTHRRYCQSSPCSQASWDICVSFVQLIQASFLSHAQLFPHVSTRQRAGGLKLQPWCICCVVTLLPHAAG